MRRPSPSYSSSYNPSYNHGISKEADDACAYGEVSNGMKGFYRACVDLQRRWDEDARKLQRGYVERY